MTDRGRFVPTRRPLVSTPLSSVYCAFGRSAVFPPLRKWRNWQTRRPQEPVRLSLMGVQVPPSAPVLRGANVSGAPLVVFGEIANIFATDSRVPRTGCGLADVRRMCDRFPRRDLWVSNFQFSHRMEHRRNLAWREVLVCEPAAGDGGLVGVWYERPRVQFYWAGRQLSAPSALDLIFRAVEGFHATSGS